MKNKETYQEAHIQKKGNTVLRQSKRDEEDIIQSNERGIRVRLTGMIQEKRQDYPKAQLKKKMEINAQ